MRAPFLDPHTKGDALLRQEIESLLAAHDTAGEFLSGPALGPLSEAHDPSRGPAAPAALPRLAAGTSLGTFTIVKASLCRDPTGLTM